ncbi:MAG TPA: hypothetical protein VJ935_05860 [Acidimicrobiia bacterium]|nr:hypothetical protein [Acidimicrobiia bacterium]
MRLEDRIRNELHDTAERLALDPGEYRRAVEAGQRRRRQQIIGTLSGMVAVAGLVVVVLALRPGGEVVVNPSSTTAPATTAPSPATTALPVATAGAAVVVAGPNGIAWSEIGATEAGVLESDPYYEAISWVVSDGDGGLVFTHEVTPLPWDQGTLLWLPAGATAPRPISAPPPQSLITPIGVEDGRVYYRLDSQGMSEIVSIDLNGQDQQLVVGATPVMIGAALADGRLAVALGGDCGSLDLYAVDGTALPDLQWMPDCLAASISDVAATGDFLFTLEDGGDARLLRRTAMATGESVAVPIPDGWQIEALDAGTVAVGGTKVIVGDFTGTSFEPRFEFGGASTFGLVRELSVRTDASLGSGLGELPCMPLDLPPLATQGLPEPVEAKRQLIFDLASGCELGRLAEVVLDDGAAFTFGDEDDPVRTWVTSARSGFDVLSMTVRILNADPAVDGSGVFAWPAVHATNAEEDWLALSGILSTAEFEQYNQYRESGYLGLRLGIDSDGRLAYLIAGD